MKKIESGVLAYALTCDAYGAAMTYIGYAIGRSEEYLPVKEIREAYKENLKK